MKNVALVLCILVGLIGVGCIPLSHYLTPADLDQNSIAYVVASNVADANKYSGYPNLYKASLLVDDIDKAYKLTQFDLQKAAEKNDLDYALCMETQVAFKNEAVQREKALFGPEGGIASILALAGFSGATGILGLMRKRPGDITPEESSAAIAQATGESQAEIEAKINQFNQVVKGVGELKKVYDETAKTDSNATVKVTDMLLTMKSIFNANQDKETQKAVATARIS